MKYDAFISYRHLPRDMYVAKGIHKALETARIPKKIQQLTGKKKIQRVFRDQDELPIGSDLGEKIEAALRESEYLIVICTPQTKESAWVMKEIDTFISLRGRNHVLAVLAEGEPEESFPPQLLSDALGNPREPLAADVRGYSKGYITNKIKTESLRLAASILGCDYDDLRQRHKERVVKRNMRIAVAVAVLGVAFGLYSAWNLARINENYREMLIVESATLAEKSTNILESGDRKTAAKIAMAGLPGFGGDRPYVSTAAYSLSMALGTYDIGEELSYDTVLQHDVQVEDFDYDPDTGYVVSYTETDEVYMWDTASGELLCQVKPEFGDGYAEIILDVRSYNSTAVVVTDYSLCAYDKEGNKLYDVPLNMGTIEGMFAGVDFSQTGERVVVTTSERLAVYDTATGEQIVAYAPVEEGDYQNQVLLFGNDIVAVVCKDDNDHRCVAIFLLDMGYMVVEPKYDYILAMNFTTDGQFWTCSMPEEDYKTFVSKPMTVEKFDVDTCQQIFEKEYMFDNSTKYSIGCKINSRKYTADGKEYSEVMLVAGKTFYLLDQQNGELIGKYSPDSEITGVVYDKDSSDVGIGTLLGTYIVLDGKTGIAYDKNITEIKAGILDLRFRDSLLIVRSYKNRNLFLLTQRAGKDSLILEKKEDPRDDYSSYISESPDGKKFCIYYPSDDMEEMSNPEITVYDTESGDKLASFKAKGCYGSQAYFTDDDTIVVPGQDGIISYYSISSDKHEQIQAIPDPVMEESYFSNNGLYMAEVEKYGGRLAIVDVCSKKVVSDQTIAEWDEYDNAPGLYAEFTGDAKSLFYISNNNRFCKTNVEKGTVEEILQDFEVRCFWLSTDDKYLLVGCKDGMLRVCDADTCKVLEVVDCDMESDCFVDVSEDGSKLYMQGRDLYIKIYDLKTHEYVYEAYSVCKEVRKFKEDTENRRLVFINTDGMIILDMDSYNYFIQCEHGKAYLHNGEYIIANTRRILRRFKVRSVDELIQDAKEEYGDCTLTEREKRRYGVR